MSPGIGVFALASILAGAVGLAFGIVFLLGAPPHAQGVAGLAAVYGGAAALILGGLAIGLADKPARAGALALAAFFLASAAVDQGPALLHQAKAWVSWEGLAEPLAMAMGALTAWSLLVPQPGRGALIAALARRVFGACLLVFGVSHFVYLSYTASLVPRWLAPSQTFWACATGAAHLAAGLALLSGVKARLAACLLTAMFAVFGLLVHLPAVLRHPHAAAAWSEQGINLLLLGAAWCVADALSKRPAPAAAFTAPPSRKILDYPWYSRWLRSRP